MAHRRLAQAQAIASPGDPSFRHQDDESPQQPDFGVVHVREVQCPRAIPTCSHVDSLYSSKAMDSRPAEA
jgi:hypothetical protein